MTDPMQPSPERVEFLLRTSRRSLMVVLLGVLLASATLLAHALRPGSLLADWPSKAPWLIPVGIAVFAILIAPGRRLRPGRAELEAELRVLNDEFRQANLARAQRLALVVVLVAQIPLETVALSGLSTAAAVTILAVTTVMLGMVTLIASFLFFDRE